MQRKDRATKLLTYLSDVIVNGNPAVTGKKGPDRIAPAPVPAHNPDAPPNGTRQLLDELSQSDTINVRITAEAGQNKLLQISR